MSFLQIAVTATSHSVVGPCLFGLGFYPALRLGGALGWSHRQGTRRRARPSRGRAGFAIFRQRQSRISGRAGAFDPALHAAGASSRIFHRPIEQVAVQFFDCTQTKSGPTSLANLMTVTVFRFSGRDSSRFPPGREERGRYRGAGRDPALMALTQHGLKTVVPSISSQPPPRPNKPETWQPATSCSEMMPMPFARFLPGPH